MENPLAALATTWRGLKLSPGLDELTFSAYYLRCFGFEGFYVVQDQFVFWSGHSQIAHQNQHKESRQTLTCSWQRCSTATVWISIGDSKNEPKNCCCFFCWELHGFNTPHVDPRPCSLSGSPNQTALPKEWNPQAHCCPHSLDTNAIQQPSILKWLVLICFDAIELK